MNLLKKLLIILFIVLFFPTVGQSQARDKTEQPIFQSIHNIQLISPYKDAYPTKQSSQLNQKEEVSANKKPDADKSKESKTLGQRMVEFIRNILGDKPKPIDEDLVRDED